MPTYTFINNDTGEEFELFMKMAEQDPYLKDNPHISRTYKIAPAISGDSAGLGFRKTDGGFNDLMNRIGDANRGSHVAEKYGSSRSARQVKVDQTVQKHKVIQGLQSARASLRKDT
jgi:predicted nucleic acid-binding Zn ribbon protein